MIGLNACRLLSGYIAAHWRGDQTLVRSYWVNTVAANLVVATATALVPIEAIRAQLPEPWSDLAILLVAYCMAPGSIALGGWQAVGVWRSATRWRAQRSGPWGGLAKCALAVGTISLLTTQIGLVASTAPLLPVYAALVHERLLVRESEIVLSPTTHGTRVVFSGYITSGAADRLQDAIDREAGSVQIVELNSPGGRAKEALRMASVVEKYKLPTHSSTGCYSGCTYPFLAGTRRTIGAGAGLGFHRGRIPAALGHLAGDELGMEGRQFLKLQGVPEWFISAVEETPPEDIWVPSREDLLRAGILTDVESDAATPNGP